MIALKTALKGIAAWLSLALLVLGALTLIRLAEAPETVGGQVTAGGGVAVVDSCQRQGPVSNRGVGYFWECQATVTPSGGAPTPETFRADELTPADGRNLVGVNQVGQEWLRNVEHPYGFLKFVGVLAGLFAVLVLVTSRDSLREMLLFRRRVSQRVEQKPPEPNGTTSVFFPVPKPVKGGQSVYWLPGVAGLVILLMGSTMTLAQYRLGQSSWWGYLVTVPFVLAGLAGLVAAPIVRREARNSPGAFVTRVDITPGGLRQPIHGGELVLPWDDIRSVVFDEHALGGRLTAHLEPANDEAVENLILDFRQPSNYGVLLSPSMRLDQAELAAKAIELFRPGLVRWPAREVKRGGFGIVRAVKRAVVRWKNARKATSTPVASTVQAKRASLVRRGVIAAFFPLTVAYLVFRLAVPPVLSAGWFVGLVTYVAMLGWSRYRGQPGEFAVDSRVITWSPAEGESVTVPRAEVAWLWAEPASIRSGRRYARLLVVRKDGSKFFAGEEVSLGAVQRVVAIAGGAPPTPITRGAT